MKGIADNTEDLAAPNGRDEKNSFLGRSQEIVGNYRLLARIGSGGMGEVYLAEHCRLERQFAVKLVRANGDSKARNRFGKEAKAIARLESEYVVSVVDCGEASDGTPYLAMELLRGEDLRGLLESEGPLPIPRAVGLIRDACHGVAAAHCAGLVHRDLKPGNLFVSRRATGEDWCKVLDFGVAKVDSSAATSEGGIIGTVKYMAPEQLLDGGSAGTAADIYALGAILYECLTGAPPFSGANVQELMFKIINERPTPACEKRHEVPIGLSSAVQRALSKSPDHRFPTVQDLARAVASYASIGTSSEGSLGDQTLPTDPVCLGLSVPRKNSLPILGTAMLSAVALAAVVLVARPSRTQRSSLPSGDAASRAASSSSRPVAAATVPTPPAPLPTPLRVAPAPTSMKLRPPGARRLSTRPVAPQSLATPAYDALNPYAR